MGKPSKKKFICNQMADCLEDMGWSIRETNIICEICKYSSQIGSNYCSACGQKIKPTKNQMSNRGLQELYTAFNVGKKAEAEFNNKNKV